MEVTHRTRNIRIAPRKLRLVIDKVRYQKAISASELLTVVPRKGALITRKSLQSAIQVAKDQDLDPSTLVIQRIWCDEGSSLKRTISHSRGRMARIMKKFSHLSIVLNGEPKTSSQRKVRETRTSTAVTESLPEPAVAQEN